MQLPFTVEQFFDVFRLYNLTIWPFQLLLLAAALAAIQAARRATPHGDRLAIGILALLWLWAGAVYHLAFFRPINTAAGLFGVLFLVQAGLFAWFGLRQRRLAFRTTMHGAGLAGGAMLLYALLVYPAFGYVLGHRYPAVPTFGAPCPLAIFTFGLLLWARPPVPRVLVVIPTLWAVISTAAAFQLGVYEDLGLLLAALIAAPMLLAGARHARIPRHA